MAHLLHKREDMRQLRDRLSAIGARVIGRIRLGPRLVAQVLLAAALLALVLLAGGRSYLRTLDVGLPDQDAIRRLGEMDQATAVYDTHDQLAFTIYKEQRIEVPFERISPSLIRAIVAIEDQRFYDHHGFDIVRIAAAAVADVRRRRAAQGGSTITQQLARQSFLTTDKTVHRKLQEVVLARRIEHLYTKPQILELYLNKVYFGDGLYGVEAASRGYFGKHASELSITEAALIAGLVKSPSTYAPTVSLERAVARRNVVLQAMYDSGAIDRDTWQAARVAPVVLEDTLRTEEPHGRYFKEQVRRELVDRFGWQRVYQGGLRVFSTLDMAMQQAAEAAVAAHLKAIEARQRTQAARRGQGPVPASDRAPLQAALVALDPDSGSVRAMVGGRNFDDSPFNRAVQARRQPGSAFKPFVYAAALEAGYTPATIIEHLNAPIPTLQGSWTPDDHSSSDDSMSLRAALRTSSNRAAVQLLQQVGIARTVQYAKSLGVGEVPSVPSLALGSGEVTLQSLTAAYAAFANHGLVPHPLLIRRVEDLKGEVLYAAADSPTRAISDTTAFLMATMMADVVDAGTGARVRREGFTLPAAGKTGTTNGFNDAWFVGFTPRLVAGVWVGFDQPHTILPNGFASEVAVPLWAAFMKVATKGDKPQWLSPPPGIVTATICRLSGKLATGGCEKVEVGGGDAHIEPQSMVYTEYFARGTEPTTSCDLHRTRGFFGAIAAVFTGVDRQTRPRVDGGGEPTGPPAVDDVAAPPGPAAEASKRKRGFWSRVFGLGRDRGKNKD